jgi:transcriptional regulator with XRE-family HTH domain
MLVRKKAKLTQSDLAKKLNVTRGTIANWENGTSNPSVEMLLELSRIFDVSVDYLIGKE